MFNFDYITKEEIKKNPNLSQNPDHPNRILIILDFGCGKRMRYLI